MSTRHKENNNGPISQGRYMSSPEFSELRGVSGVAAAARTAILLLARKKNLVWFLQGLSLKEGGLKRVANELLKMFPDRLDDDWQDKAFFNSSNSPREFDYHYYFPSLEQFLIDLCINPRLCFSVPGEDPTANDATNEFENELCESKTGLSKYDFKPARLDYFRDIMGALFEYKLRYEKKVRENFQLTAIGKKIWETLDFAHERGRMVVLDGLEGRGKSEAIKAWCDLHIGSSRLVTLKGIAGKTTVFREIAKSLGIASSYSRKSIEMQARVEDVLKMSRMMLVIDEAHFLFNQNSRMYSRPELIDWIDTALCNRGVPVALVTTPQFMICLTRAADQLDWNYRQFRRRVSRWEKLPANNSESDISAVARKVFKKANSKIISEIVGYSLLSKRDLSAIGDIADEVRSILGHEDLSQANAEHIHAAIHERLLPSDKTFVEGMAAARSIGKKQARRVVLQASDLRPENLESKVEIQTPARRGSLEPAQSNRLVAADNLIVA